MDEAQPGAPFAAADGQLTPGRIGSIAIGDRPTAERLARFNRRGRMAFWSARRHGASEALALAAAERTLPR